MLRIHFTPTDLVRTKLAERPDHLWETVLSLQTLRTRYGGMVFNSWRLQAGTELRKARFTVVLSRILAPLTPNASYFPDFLTPPEGLLGIEPGIEAIRATPGSRIRTEVQRLALTSRLPSEVLRIAEGERDAMLVLCRSLIKYYEIAVAPYWDRDVRAADMALAKHGLRQRASGSISMLMGIWPGTDWDPPVLRVPYPVSRDLHLEGRGLILIPSMFLWNHPVAYADPALPPTLIYPIRPTSDLLRSEMMTSAVGSSLAALIGTTRARILGAVGQGATTSDLARRAGVSVTMASEHARVLRDAGLIDRRRRANTVVHTMTSLGMALYHQDPNNPPAPASAGGQDSNSRSK